MCFRIAVREVEAWLLADRVNIAKFLHVSLSRIPLGVEDLEDPKQTMVNLARQSGNRGIREDMVPRPSSRRSIGPAYPSRLIESTENRWDPNEASLQSTSLRRAIACIRRTANAYAGSKSALGGIA